MKSSWFVGLFFLFAGLQLLCSIATGGVPLPSTGGDYNLAQMLSFMTPTGFSGTNPLVGLYDLIIGVWTFLVTFINMLFWNYPTLFDGGWQYVRYIFFMPISLMMVITFLLSLRGNSSS